MSFSNICFLPLTGIYPAYKFLRSFWAPVVLNETVSWSLGMKPTFLSCVFTMFVMLIWLTLQIKWAKRHAQQTGGSSACLDKPVPLAPNLCSLGGLPVTEKRISLLLCFTHSPLLTEATTFCTFGSKIFRFLWSKPKTYWISISSQCLYNACCKGNKIQKEK